MDGRKRTSGRIGSLRYGCAIPWLESIPCLARPARSIACGNLAVAVPVDILLDDMYLPLKGAFFKGYRLVLERRAKAYDPPMPLETEFRRKVRTLAGNWQLVRELPELVGRQNRMWLHYVSYKLGRLLLPWFLMLFLVFTWLLPWPWNSLFGVPQIAVYAAGGAAA